MTADDALRDEIARAIALERRGVTAKIYDTDLRVVDAILPIVARVEREAYRRGQAERDELEAENERLQAENERLLDDLKQERRSHRGAHDAGVAILAERDAAREQVRQRDEVIERVRVLLVEAWERIPGNSAPRWKETGR